MANYSAANFVVIPPPGEKLDAGIRVYNISGVYQFSIEPWISTFTQKNRYVYIVLQNNVLFQNTLDFNDECEAREALAKLNEIKKIYATSEQIYDSYVKPELEDGSYILNLSGLTVSGVDVYYALTHMATGSTGSGSITVKDQNTGFINSAVTILNFIGNNPTTNVRVLENGISQVDIWIVAPDYVDKFNQGSATVSSASMTTRRISSPTSEGVPFYISPWTGDLNEPTTRSSTLTYSTASLFSLETQSTTFYVEISGPQGIISSGLTILSGNGIINFNDITLTITGYATDSDKWKCNISAVFNISNLLPNGGRFNIKLQHNNVSTYTFTQNNCFFDSQNNTMIISNLTINENIPVIKYLSGVRYYDLGSTFTVNIADIDYSNDKSYPDIQLTLDGSDYGLPNLSKGRSDLVGWTSLWNNSNSSYNNSNWAITRTNWYSLDTNAMVHATPQDWSPGTTINSLGDGIAIDTYSNNSTRISEDFSHETTRLMSNYSTVWDSTQNILTYDGGNGLQISNNRLVYPSINYNNIYNPNKSLQPDYSTASGNKTYIRIFYNNTSTSSSGILRFGGTNISDFYSGSLQGDIVSGSSTKIILEISIDLGTTWYVINKPYIGGSLLNGSGCRVSSDTHNLSADGQIWFTLGYGFSNYILLKITYLDNAKDKYIDSLDLLGGNWV